MILCAFCCDEVAPAALVYRHDLPYHADCWVSEQTADATADGRAERYDTEVDA